MDEITDQFRTEDAEEFKQLQAELEVAGIFHLLLSVLLILFFFFQVKIVESFNLNYVNPKSVMKL